MLIITTRPLKDRYRCEYFLYWVFEFWIRWYSRYCRCDTNWMAGKSNSKVVEIQYDHAIWKSDIVIRDAANEIVFFS